MSRLSRNQKRRRQELEEQMNQGLFPIHKNTFTFHQDTFALHQNMFPISRYRLSETTKETCYSLPENQKQKEERMNQGQDRIWESSPSGEAAFSQSSLTPEQPALTSEAKKERNRADLVSTARLLFPARQKLYSVDVFGRRSEIDTRFLSSDGYLSLLEACKNPIRLNDVASQVSEIIAVDATREIPEGCKMGVETELPIPDWWEVPEERVEGETINMPAMIRRNLERAKREGKGIFSRGLTGLGGGLTTLGGAR
jgi:hypothetical protein